MLKSSDVAYLKPSNFNNKYCILGIGKGFLLILLFSSLNSEMKQTIPLFLEIIKVGVAHLELFLRFNTPIFINLLNSFFKVCLCILKLEKVCHGMFWLLLKKLENVWHGMFWLLLKAKFIF